MIPTFRQETAPIDPRAVVEYGTAKIGGVNALIGYCQTSNIAFLRDCPTPDHYAQTYANSYWQEPSHVEPETHRAKSANRVRLLLELDRIPVIKEPRILDFGTGYGFALPLLTQRFGGMAEGIEPNAYAAKFATERGARIVGNWVSDITGPYDIISLIQVLEHQPHPTHLLTKARDALSPNGFMLIQVPDLQAAHGAPVSFAHPVCFSPRALVMLLNQLGMAVLSVKASDTKGHLGMLSVVAVRGEGGIPPPPARPAPEMLALQRKLGRMPIRTRIRRTLKGLRKIAAHQARKVFAH